MRTLDDHSISSFVGDAGYHWTLSAIKMKNSRLDISDKWKVVRDEFYEINPYDKLIDENTKYLNLYIQEDLLLIQNRDYHIDLGWYGENIDGNFQLYLYRGINWHNCELLEKVSTRNYETIIKLINQIAQNVDSEIYNRYNTQSGSIDEFIDSKLISTLQTKLSILNLQGKVNALKRYLEANKDDEEGDSWTFGHHPIIIEHLNTFNETEFDELKKEITTWKDELIGNLADPISECKNAAIKGNLIYCQIFNQLEDIESLEYLIQNLGAVAWGIEEKQSEKFYTEISTKANRVNTKLGHNYDHTISELEKIKKADNK